MGGWMKVLIRSQNKSRSSRVFRSLWRLTLDLA
jgi:hypothetical protein